MFGIVGKIYTKASDYFENCLTILKWFWRKPKKGQLLLHGRMTM